VKKQLNCETDYVCPLDEDKESIFMSPNDFNRRAKPPISGVKSLKRVF